MARRVTRILGRRLLACAVTLACAAGARAVHADVVSDAAAAILWTRRRLSSDECDWLRELKYTRLVASFSLVHASLDGPQRWGYVFDKLMAAASICYQNANVCFHGAERARGLEASGRDLRTNQQPSEAMKIITPMYESQMRKVV